MKLSPTQIKEIAERAEKATPGPWLIGTHQILDADGKHVLWAAKPNNRDFTAHARQDIPALLAHIAAQDGEMRRLERERDEARARIAQLESQIVVKDAALKWDIEHCLQCCGTGEEAHREVLGSIPFDCPYCAKAREALKGSAK